MEILVLMAIPTAIVWSVVAAKYGMQLLPEGGSGRYVLPLRPLPTAMTIAMLCGIVFGYEFFHYSLGPAPLTLDRVLFAGIILAYGIQYLRHAEDLLPLSIVDGMMLAWFFLIAISVFTHDFRYQQNAPLARLIFFYGMPLSVYWVMRHVKLSLSDLRLILLAFAGLAIYLALMGIAEVKGWHGVVFPRQILEPGEFFGRARGPLQNPVINGILMVLGGCCMWTFWPKVYLRGRIAIVMLTTILAAGVFATLTRSVWLGLIAAGAVMIWYPASRRQKGIMMVCAMVLFTMALPFVGENLFSFKRDTNVSQADMEQSAKLRPLFATVAWRMFQDRPLVGCGYGQYAREKTPYLLDPASNRPLRMTAGYVQHNVFLAYLVEMGIAGLGILLVVMGLIIRESWRLWRQPDLDWLVRLFGLLMISLLINYAINGMFHDVSIIPVANLLMFFFFGIVVNLRTATVCYHELLSKC